MIDLKQFETMDPVDVSDQKMAYFKEELLKMRDELLDAWSDEVKKLDSDDFDPYSFFGERKIKKISKQHSKKLAEVDLLLDVIDDEMSRRDNYNEEQRYMGTGKYVPKYSTDSNQYLKNEEQKTEKIRRKYEDEE